MNPLISAFINWSNYTDLTSFGMKQGGLAALVFLFGLLLIWLLPRYKWLAAAALLILITPLTIGGYWFSENELGISDWDFYFSLHTTHRNTLLNYGQLPHWNPYICGGTAGIADPEFRFFTPTFLLQLIFGIPAGFRLAIFLTTATGAVGMLMLGKRLGLSVYGALLAAIGVAFGSVNLLEITEGHPNVFAAMYIPWIFWAWLAAYRLRSTKSEARNPKRVLNFGHFNFKFVSDFIFSASGFWSLVCGAFLTLTFFQGGIYLLMYTIIAFFGLLFLVKRPWAAFWTTATAGLWALGLAAIKLIPVLLWLSQFQDEAYAGSTYILPYLDTILLERILHGPREIIPNQLSGWHEYGAYIGPVVLILAAVGFVRYRTRRVVQALLVAAVAATLLASSGPVLKPLFDVVPVIPRSNISRFMLFAVIPLSLLAGFGVDSLKAVLQNKLQHKSRRLRVTSYQPSPRLWPAGELLVIIVLFLAALDLFSLAYPLSEQAFILPRHLPHPSPAPSPIAYTAHTYEYEYSPTSEMQKYGIPSVHTRAYEATLVGYGTLSYCSVLTPPIAVRTIHDEGGNELIAFENTKNLPGSFTVQDWSPNRVHVTVTVPVESTVFLNANYAKGWYTNGQPAQERGNRIGTTVPAGTHDLVFEYRTRGFVPGILISALSATAAGYILYRRYAAGRG